MYIYMYQHEQLGAYINDICSSIASNSLFCPWLFCLGLNVQTCIKEEIKEGEYVFKKSDRTIENK